MIRKLLKITLSIWGIFAFVVGCLVPITIALIWWSSPVKENDWRSKTSPLPLEVVLDICSRFDAQSESLPCSSPKNVYAPDLFPIIEDSLIQNETTYENIQSMLGQYQADFEPPVTLGNGEEYFVSWYDLQGDGTTAMVFFFNGDGTLRETLYHLGNDE
jgi:hypothetical protein